MNRSLHRLLAACLLVAAINARAEVYELPPQGFDVIGSISTVTARHEDTLVDIARRHGLGYQDIVRANPDVNIWLPGEGTEIVLPTQYVLPPGPRTGIVLNLAEYRMYYYPEPREGEPAYVMTYPISIGRQDWATPLGRTSVVAKASNPSWYPPQSVLDEHAARGDSLPRVVPPGPDNPLGKFAMRLGLPGYLIHGTNRPAGVGMRVTHGCIRMFPEDIEFLFARIDVNTAVRIINEPVKLGWSGGEIVMEVHPVLETAPLSPEEMESDEDFEEFLAALPVVKSPLTHVTERFIVTTAERSGQLDWRLAEQVVERSDGIPVPVGRETKNAATSAAFYQ
jgi:L,D-transpeptidase ErfK/SrfK